MTESGAVGWQGALNANNDAFFAESDLMFVDFRWSTASLASSATYAKGMGREPAELFAGIDTGARQFAIQPSMDAIFSKATASGVSVALYRPDFTLTGTADPSQFPARESRFWVGEDGDPSSSEADAQGWRGMSAEIAEHTSVTSLPFWTSFGTGHGRQWCRRGRQIAIGDWNNLSAQDVLPTWRWWVTGSPLSIDYDYETVWRGGNSVRITGTLHEPTTIALFATRVVIEEDTRLDFILSERVGATAIARFLDDPDTDVALFMVQGDADGWTHASTGPLVGHRGRTLIRVGLRLDASGPVDVRLGEMRLLPGPALRLRAPRRLSVQRSRPGYRVYWHGQRGVRYDVEGVRDDAGHTWLGTTTAGAFYVAEVDDDVHALTVVPIAADGRRGPAGVVGLP
jgi:mannosyl-glycoprotein endo-beta-N-acetylglucosaminidase